MADKVSPKRLPAEQWLEIQSKYEIEGDSYDADEEIIRQKMILNPNEYEELKKTEEVEKEGELNEVRKRAGLETKLFYTEDEYIKNLKAMAGM